MPTLVEQLIKSVVEKNQVRMNVEKTTTSKNEKTFQKNS